MWCKHTAAEHVEIVIIWVPWFYIGDYTGCFLDELWDLSATSATFLSDVRLLNDADQYQSCGNRSVVLNDTRTATVAYYNDTTPGSRACFVCDQNSGYTPNTTTTAERVCRSNGTWSGSPIVCGMLLVCVCIVATCIHAEPQCFLFSLCNQMCHQMSTGKAIAGLCCQNTHLQWLSGHVQKADNIPNQLQYLTED